MTSFKRFESKPVVKKILIYDRLNNDILPIFTYKNRNNSWKPYVYIVFTTGRPFSLTLGVTLRDIKAYPW